MNSSAAQLLRTLDTLGVQSLRFSILSNGKHLRHSAPVALSTTSDQSASTASALSVVQLFAAYGLTPRKGDYVLNVEDGCLAYLSPAEAQATKTVRPRAASFKRARKKLKAAARRRAVATRSPSKLAA